MVGVHRRAVNKMLRATELGKDPVEAPLVELVKSLADDLDAGVGGERAKAAYLSALKDVRRVAALRSRDEASVGPSLSLVTLRENLKAG